MFYDSPLYGNNGRGEYLGKFKHLKQIRDDFYVDDFIALNLETNELCIVLSREIKGHGGGIKYIVTPLNEFKHDILADIHLAEWKMVLDDFDDDVGNRETPHCTNCNRGVYKHDAGLYCPFCGSIMKNPIVI